MIQLAACLGRHLPHVRESRADGELLAAFLAEHNDEAFSELVRRHGPLVWAACRRLLPDPADAEDAFQSSFLVLVRRGRRLRNRDTLGPWLYQVAVWTARNIRRRNARIMAKRKPLGDSAAASTSTELRTDIDDALAALPEKYRAPLVLCHLQGWSRREAAERLGCPEGTLSSLLSRGLERLRTKLSGFDPAKALTVAAPAAPLLLANSTVKAAVGMQMAAAGAVSATVHQLVEGVVRMFWIKKATAASFALVAVFGMGMGIGFSVKQVPGAVAGDGPGVASAPNSEDDENRVLFMESLAQLELSVIEAEAAKAKGTPAEVEAALKKVNDARERVDRLRKVQDLREAKRKLLSREAADKETDAGARSLADALAKVKAAQDAVAEAKKAGQAQRLAEMMRELAVAQNAAEQARLRMAIRKATPIGPVAQQAREQRELEEQIAKLEAEQELLAAQAQKLAVRRDAAQRQLALLEAMRMKDRLIPEKADAGGEIVLTVTPAGSPTPFKIVETAANGKPVGTLTFDTLEILKQYLLRTGKDPKAPKTVRFTTVPSGIAGINHVVEIIKICEAAGLKFPPETPNPGKERTEADGDHKRLIEAFIRLREQAQQK